MDTVYAQLAHLLDFDEPSETRSSAPSAAVDDDLADLLEGSGTGVSNNVRSPFLITNNARDIAELSKGFKFPSPERCYSKKRNSSFQKSIIRYAIRIGLRFLNQHRSDETSAESLALVLEQVILERGHRYVNETRHSRRFTWDDAERMARRAAETAIEYWDPSYTAQRKLMARAGGRKSKRPPKFTPADLAGIEHLSKAEQARLLGCSESTVARLRRATATPPSASL